MCVGPTPEPDDGSVRAQPSTDNMVAVMNAMKTGSWLG
jgi:hypothetical protein